ncbi:MAG: hypothetical protein KF699_12010 [Phycisphaeraceae bacterium]|nr:hypothetical protein [Phycisphaeraceae bacterium]
MNPQALFIALALVLALVLPSDAARAQGRATAATGTGDIQLQIGQFGVGGAARPGDWAGIELLATDSSNKPRNVLFRIRLRDPDGDRPLMQRVVTLNPGIRQSVWLYARLPATLASGGLIEFTAHEAVEIKNGLGEVIGHEPGVLQAVLPVQTTPNQVAPTANGLIAIVGRRKAGLDQYQANRRSGSSYSPTGHEITEILDGIEPARMPDRWMAYAPFEAVVWTGAASTEQPSLLSETQAEALREWVRRGGHLIVIVPPAAQGWVGVPANPLESILPVVALDRREGEDLDHFRPMLTRRANVALPASAVVNFFRPRPDAAPTDALPIINGPDGTPVVVRRLVGTGAVTLIGLDLTTRPIADVAGALQADLFWHRVLGKRLPLLSPADLERETIGDMAAGKRPKWQFARQDADLDGAIGGLVTRSARAAAGLLMAFVVFVMYWLAAGPVGYFLLKERNWKHHAWVAFVGAAALFTAISWGGASVLRTRKIEGQHVTLVDHVYGQSNQRMRSWFTVLLPRYGEQRVAIGTQQDLERWRHTVAAWEAIGGSGGAGLASFPDARSYVVDSRAPWALEVPARATTKTFQADWAGGLPANWRMIRPVAAENTPIGREIRVVPNEGPGRTWRLEGAITHDLPGELQAVDVIVVLGQTNLRTPTPTSLAYSSGELQARVVAFSKPGGGSWKPGEVIDLGAITGGDARAPIQDATMWLRSLVPQASTGIGLSPNERALRDVTSSLNALAFFSVLAPPDPDLSATQTVARRHSTHGWDLSRWFTQPCIIVIGHLTDDGTGKPTECPMPISVDNSDPDFTRKGILGRTMVRWVYPLVPAPPAMERRMAFEDAPGDEQPITPPQAEPTP